MTPSIVSHHIDISYKKSFFYVIQLTESGTISHLIVAIACFYCVVYSRPHKHFERFELY